MLTVFIHSLIDWLTFLAQSSPPSPADLAQQLNLLQAQVDALQSANQALSDGLTSQIEFLKAENQSITDSFSTYIEAMKWNLTALTGLAAILGVAGGWVFKNSLEDAKETAGLIVRQELTSRINPLIANESDNIRRTLQTEQIIGRTIVDYYLPAMGNSERTEFDLLSNRGFSDVRWWDANKKPIGKFGGVLVVDFVNCELISLPGLTSDDKEVQKTAVLQRDEIVNSTIRELVDLRIGNPIIVAYVRPGKARIGAIDKLTQTFQEIDYYASANTPVSLMGAVVDSAYVAWGDQFSVGKE